MNKVRIAIVGVGNCASSLVQGLEYYKDADPSEKVPGLMHVELGGYHVRDIEVVAAFDVDGKKVGTDVAEAIFTEPNNTIKFAETCRRLGVTVSRGRTLDGLGAFYREVITESDEPEADVVQVLKDSNADVMVSYLPVGSEDAARFYAQCAIDAGVGFVNCLPAFIASDPCGLGSSARPACRSWATTSSRRSAPRSRTVSSRSSSRTAARSSTGPTS